MLPARALTILSVALALLGAVSSAQGADDILVMDPIRGFVLDVTRARGVSTLQVLPGMMTYGPITNGPGDGSILVTATSVSTIQTYLLRVTGAGVTTLSSFASIPVRASAIDLDDAGDLLVLARQSGAGNGLYRTQLTGSTTLTRVAAWPTSLSEPMAFTEKLDTGDWWVLDQTGTLYVLARNGGAVLSIMKPTAMRSFVNGGLQEAPFSGELLVAASVHLLRAVPVVKWWINVLGMSYGEVTGVSFDPVTRCFLVTWWRPEKFGPGGWVGIYDQLGKSVIPAIGLYPHATSDAVVAWGRSFTPHSPPDIGKTYTIQLLWRPLPGRAYQAALAFACRPGFKTEAGWVPLANDALLACSLAGAPIFRGFRGVLDAGGRATLHIDIPNLAALRGTRIHLAALVIGKKRIRKILGPHGFNIR